MKNIKEVLSIRLWKLEVSDYIVLLMILVYSITFSYFTIQMHYSFRSYAWDLGTIVQSLSSATKGLLFTSNVELYYSPTGSYFGIHFSPLLFVILVFFYFLPKVETILIVETLILSLGVIPLYKLANNCLKDRLSALLISASYLLNVSLQSINWYYLTPQTFLPLFFLSATYFLKTRRFIPFFAFVILSLMTFEQATYFVAIYAIYVGYELKDEMKRGFRSRTFSFDAITPLIVIFATIVWFIFSRSIIYGLNPNPSSELKALANYAFLDIKDISEIPLKVVTRPDMALKAINYDFPSKLLYVAMMFIPSGFLALLSPMALLPVLPWLFLSFFANHPPYYNFGFHYPALTLPFIMVATVEAIGSLAGSQELKGVKTVLRKLCTMFFAVSLISSLFASPLSPLQKPSDFRFFRDYGVTTPSLLDVMISRTLEEFIPKDARMITTPTVFPHVAININAYTIPPNNFPSTRLYEGHLRYLQNIEYEYVFYTYFWDKDESEVIYNSLIENNNIYGLFVKGPGVELYKRGYSGSPRRIPVKFSYRELLTHDSVVVDDPSSESGKVLMLEAAPIEGRYGWFGPYITLLPGNYTVNFRIRVDHLMSKNVIRLDVRSNSTGRTISFYDVYGSDFSRSLLWHTFSFSFEVSKRISEVEFRGIEAANDVTLWLDYIEVVPN